MAYIIKKNHDTLVWEGKHLDIWTGHDDESGRFYVDIVYHKTDVGLYGVKEDSFSHLNLTRKQLELAMENWAKTFCLGYERAKEGEEK